MATEDSVEAWGEVSRQLQSESSFRLGFAGSRVVGVVHG